MAGRRMASMRGRRALLRLAALGLGGVAVACGGRGGNDNDSGSAQGRGRPTAESKGPDGATAPGAAAPTSETVVGEPQCLVTKANGLPTGYTPSDLVLVPLKARALDDVQLRRAAAEAFTDLSEAGESDGLRILGQSGFRSYQQQQRAVDENIRLLGKTEAERVVAPPGHSEHQLGLAVDVYNPHQPGIFDESFGQEPEGRWVAANCAKFGFVLSYPQGKESVTGYAYEPWHIRFVGRQLAEKIAGSGLTLTEFLPKYNLAGPCP